jgi:hypothetical protein
MKPWARASTLLAGVAIAVTVAPAGHARSPAGPDPTCSANYANGPLAAAPTLRVSRLFETDGQSGIAHFIRIIDRYTRQGFDTELQVRYHPSVKQRGNIAAYREAQRRGYRQLRFGFTFAYRFNPISDAAVFTGNHAPLLHAPRRARSPCADLDHRERL